MSTESIDPDLVEQTKHQIRGLVNEIAQLARQDVTVREFYSEFLSRVVSALAAIGGAVWRPGEGEALELEYQVNLREAKLADSQDDLVRHNRLLARVAATGEGAVIPPYSGEGAADQAANPTGFLLVLAPIRIEQETKGVVEIFQRPGADVRTQRGYLRFLLQMCDLAADYLKTRQLRHFTDRQALWNQLEGFARAAHASLNPRETAYTIVNEGRRLIGCDRVSVAFCRGRKCRIEAVSGQDVLDRRSNVVALLNRLSTAVVAAGEPMWYTGDTSNFAPQVEDAVQAYVDESHAKNVAVLPLIKPGTDKGEHDRGESIGALIVEQIEDARTREGMVQRVNVVCDHSASALANAIEHDSLFLLPVWRTLGKAQWLVSARTLPKTVAVLIAVAAAVAALILVPADFDLQGKGKLQPSIRRDVFAGTEGTVDVVEARHGQEVKAGQLLATMFNTQMEVDIKTVIGQIGQAEEQLKGIRLGFFSGSRGSQDEQRPLSNAERNKLKSDEADVMKQIIAFKAKHELLIQKQKLLSVTSPIDGQVTTWDPVKLLLTRTVRPTDVLLTVADPSGPWELEILMPEDRIGHVLRAQDELGKELKVQFILANDPGTTHTGTVSEIHLSAEPRGEEGNTVLVRVSLTPEEKAALGDNLNNGAGVTAKIHCGRTSLGYKWFHDVIAFIQSRVLFRL